MREGKTYRANRRAADKADAPYKALRDERKFLGETRRQADKRRESHKARELP